MERPSLYCDHLAIIFTAIWSALVTYGIIKVIAHYMPLRVSDRDEAIGLDDCEYKEHSLSNLYGLRFVGEYR